MKKILSLVGLLFLGTVAYAVNNSLTGAPAVQLVPPQGQVQIFMDTNNNAVITAPSLIINSQLFLSSYTITALNTLTPAGTGQIVWCANCVASNLCISTGTAVGSFVAANSTSTTNQVVCK